MQLLTNEDILFIINPNSGSKRIARIVNEINSLEPPVSYVITNNLNELKEAFRLNIEKHKAFIVVGGDGTVNEAINYLHKRSDKLLGVLPAGSGNGFARELGFKNSIPSLIRDTKKGEFIPIDILSINESPCINVAGLGFDSYVAHNFQHCKSRGLKNYIFHTLKAIGTFKPFRAKLTIGNEIFQGEFHTITIANTRQFGNNAIIAPQAKPNDETIELVLVKAFPIYMYPVFIARLFLGSLKDSKYVRYLKVKDSFEIASEFKKYHVDGEARIFTDSLSVDMMKEKVNIIKTEHNIL